MAHSLKLVSLDGHMEGRLQGPWPTCLAAQSFAVDPLDVTE